MGGEGRREEEGLKERVIQKSQREEGEYMMKRRTMIARFGISYEATQFWDLKRCSGKGNIMHLFSYSSKLAFAENRKYTRN